ncbi:MAG: hypothetical protein QOK02_469, partial [Mycobacterium sp.]|nr:hypothetical protein [Mycobacterium sp.]
WTEVGMQASTPIITRVTQVTKNVTEAL